MCNRISYICRCRADNALENEKSLRETSVSYLRAKLVLDRSAARRSWKGGVPGGVKNRRKSSFAVERIAKDFWAEIKRRTAPRDVLQLMAVKKEEIGINRRTRMRRNTNNPSA